MNSTTPMRFLSVLALLALPLVASAAPSDGPLDALSETPGFERAAPPAGVPDEVAAPAPGGAPTQVPLDGGLSLLALAGAGYAARRLRARRG